MQRSDACRRRPCHCFAIVVAAVCLTLCACVAAIRLESIRAHRRTRSKVGRVADSTQVLKSFPPNEHADAPALGGACWPNLTHVDASGLSLEAAWCEDGRGPVLYDDASAGRYPAATRRGCPPGIPDCCLWLRRARGRSRNRSPGVQLGDGVMACTLEQAPTRREGDVQCCCRSARVGVGVTGRDIVLVDPPVGVPVYTCLPMIVIAGAPKAATTALWSRLAHVPGFVAPLGGVKEIGYFSTAAVRYLQATNADGSDACGAVLDVSAYLRAMPPGPFRHQVDFVAPAARAWAAKHFTVDGSAFTFVIPGGACLLQRMLPRAHIVLATRDPIDRVRSELRQVTRRQPDAKAQQDSMISETHVTLLLHELALAQQCAGLNPLRGARVCATRLISGNVLRCLGNAIATLTSIGSHGMLLRSIYPIGHYRRATLGESRVHVIDHADIEGGKLDSLINAQLAFHAHETVQDDSLHLPAEMQNNTWQHGLGPNSTDSPALPKHLVDALRTFYNAIDSAC